MPDSRTAVNRLVVWSQRRRHGAQKYELPIRQEFLNPHEVNLGLWLMEGALSTSCPTSSKHSLCKHITFVLSIMDLARKLRLFNSQYCHPSHHDDQALRSPSDSSLRRNSRSRAYKIEQFLRLRWQATFYEDWRKDSACSKLTWNHIKAISSREDIGFGRGKGFWDGFKMSCVHGRSPSIRVE